MVGEAERPKAETFPTPKDITVGAPAGLPIGTAPGNPVATLVKSKTTNSRAYIFALHDFEQEYDTKARNERVFATTGQYWGTVFIPTPETVQVDINEPQPFRRLAGVLVGDSVMAIIDMGNNAPMQVIRPGMQIPNSPWKVVSIDEDKAVLRRTGNKRPKEIIVRLQGPQVPGGGGGGVNPGANPSRPTNPQRPNNGTPRRGGRPIRGGSGGIG